MSRALQKAKAEVTRLFGLELEFTQRLRAEQSEAQAMIARTTGDDILAAALAPPPLAAEQSGEAQPVVETPAVDLVARAMTAGGDRLMRLQGRIASAEAAIEAARRGRRAAILEAWKLDAQEKQHEAARLREQAAAIDAKGRPHLEALNKLYGCTFIPATALVVARAAAGAMLDGPLAIPITSRFVEQAAALEQDAVRLQTRQVSTSGGVTAGGSVDALVAALASASFSLAPPLPDCLAWADHAVAEARVEWRSYHAVRDAQGGVDELHADRVRLSLVWRDARIVESESGFEILPVRDAAGAVIR